MITIKELRTLIEVRLAKRFPSNIFYISMWSEPLANPFLHLNYKQDSCFCRVSAEKEPSSYIYKVEAFLDWLAQEIAAKNISGEHFRFLLRRKYATVEFYSLRGYPVTTAYAAHLANQNPINIKP